MYSIYEAQQHRKEVVDCQKVACKYINNASIYSSPIYSNNNNLLHGWLILHGWTIFSSKEWNLEKMLSRSIQCSWMIYYIGYFKSKFGIFLCRRNEMRKMVVKSNIQLKTMNDARGGWVFFGTVDFLENTGHSISLWFSHPIYYGKPGKHGESLGKIFLFILFDFIDELEWKKLWCVVSKKRLNPMSSMQSPKIVIYLNKYLFQVWLLSAK
jgi:hypothetical protein